MIVPCNDQQYHEIPYKCVPSPSRKPQVYLLALGQPLIGIYIIE